MSIMTIGGGILHNEFFQIVDECHVFPPSECPCSADAWEALVSSGTSCSGFVKEYRISGYSDGDLTLCGTCQNRTGPIWQGNFRAHSEIASNIRCQWDRHFGVGGPEIEGKMLHTTKTRIYLNTVWQRWHLDVYCYPGTTPMWGGWKEYGLTPRGTYTRVQGCDTTSSLEIVS